MTENILRLYPTRPTACMSPGQALSRPTTSNRQTTRWPPWHHDPTAMIHQPSSPALLLPSPLPSTTLGTCSSHQQTSCTSFFYCCSHSHGRWCRGSNYQRPTLLLECLDHFPLPVLSTCPTRPFRTPSTRMHCLVGSLCRIHSGRTPYRHQIPSISRNSAIGTTSHLHDFPTGRTTFPAGHSARDVLQSHCPTAGGIPTFRPTFPALYLRLYPTRP
jgi:hypothetical protein